MITVGDEVTYIGIDKKVYIELIGFVGTKIS